MTTINCSLNCMYQNDGKCTLDNTKVNPISSNSACVYFSEKNSGPPTDISLSNS